MNHSQRIWSKYFFSTDHKMIGLQYTIMGLFMAAIGGYLAYVFRQSIAFPGESINFYGSMGPGQYNSFVTMHGMIMFFWVAMPLLVAGLGNLLIPLMIGTDDMAFPTLNMLSFWVFFLSVLVLFLSFLVPGGSFAGGWTLYPPLSTDAYINKNPNFWESFFRGGPLLIIAIVLEFTSILMGGINFLVTSINKRAQGMSFFRIPLFVWMVNTAGVLFMLSVGPLIAGGLMLFFDMVVGTGFYDATRGGDPILFQHLFWFFGHPEVYVILLPALGVIAEIITTFSRKPIFAYKTIIYATLISCVLSFIVWGHHQFIAGINPRMATFFSISTIFISIPFSTIMLSYIATLWGGSIRFTVPMMWALGMIFSFLIGGLTGVFLSSHAFDTYAHDTYFVVAHFHYTVIPVVILSTMGAIYYWFPKFTGIMLNETLGKIHFWFTFVFFNLFAFPLFFTGLAGDHRRINEYTAFDSLNTGWLPELRIFSTVCATILMFSQIIFIINLISSIRKGRNSPSNPWEANTLEWQTDSPPPHGNFKTAPIVYRGAYEYSVPGRESDYYPQNEA